MCDGSGYYDEHYIDVDLTAATRCFGCAQCDEEIAEADHQADLQAQLAAQLDAQPLWAGMTVYDTPPMPAYMISHDSRSLPRLA